ncbi:MAG: thioredoxin domain-containing protein [Candidatus Nanoarchaeia archaeon]|nr:thioredoxin domain-containing protein [Candidatus Nanoarchaeia archaeon]
MNRLESVDQIPTSGIVVVLVQVESRTPCKKFLNEMNASISELLKDVNATYYTLELTNTVKESLGVHYIPTVIVYKDEKEIKRFNGHYWSKFQIAGYIREGL